VPVAVGVKRTDTVPLAPGARYADAFVALASRSTLQRGVRPHGRIASVQPGDAEPRARALTPFGMTMVNNPSFAPLVALLVIVKSTVVGVPTVAEPPGTPSTLVATLTGCVIAADPGCEASNDTTNRIAATAAVTTVQPRVTRRLAISSAPLWTGLIMRRCFPRGPSFVRWDGTRHTEEDHDYRA
jgi:hypothetical protein